MTSICYIGSKSMSHAVSCIERCKDRLLGLPSDAARRQVITSVVEYWRDQPGNAVNIVDKLLNYTIVSPEAVVSWALGVGESGFDGRALAESWRYEMVAGTVGKVTNRVRQIVNACIQGKTQGLPAEQVKMLDDTLARERSGMRALFALIDDVVGGIAQGAGDGLIEAEMAEVDAELVRRWGAKWARVFRRKAAVEETVVGEMSVAVALAAAPEHVPVVEEEVKGAGAMEGENGEKDAAAEAAAEADVEADMDVA
jgi:nuclear cap-binding protein subunit 1